MVEVLILEDQLQLLKVIKTNHIVILQVLLILGIIIAIQKLQQLKGLIQIVMDMTLLLHRVQLLLIQVAKQQESVSPIVVPVELKLDLVT